MASHFDSELEKALDFSSPGTDPFGVAYDELKKVVKSIERRMNTDLGDKIEVDIEPGFQATMGQQLKVVLRIPSKQFRDSLFRVYIPDEGKPIMLDLYGEDPVPCDTTDKMQKEIIDFLAKIKDRMNTYRDYATD